MRLVIGLGNPGERYRFTRHNVGFMALEAFARRIGVEFATQECYSLVGSGKLGEEELILAKPLTYMNRSGFAVKGLLDRYGLPYQSMVLIYDDMDLPVGRLRIRPGGGPGGHNGMKSVIESTGGTDFPRVRVGIGRPPPVMDPVDYVLQSFEKTEIPIIMSAIEACAEAIETIIQEGLDQAMNRFNSLVI